MQIDSWPCALPDGRVSDELAIRTGPGETRLRLLVIPPLFAEHNLLRRQIVEVMRNFQAAEIDAILPDLPGQNESLQPLNAQTIAFWTDAMAEASRAFGAAKILAIRSGALLVPSDAGGWLYAPHSGAKLLRGMIRARVIASREAGQAENSEDLFERGRQEGLTLGGWPINAEMFRELEAATPPTRDGLLEIDQRDIGGPGLWLRAEPGESAEQAARLAQIILTDIPDDAKANA